MDVLDERRMREKMAYLLVTLRISGIPRFRLMERPIVTANDPQMILRNDGESQ